MRSSTAASLYTEAISSGGLHRHPARGGNHHRRPSSSSRRPPWRGGRSSASRLRVCTSSYVFDISLSLSHDLVRARSWYNIGFVKIVGSYGVLPSLLCCDELSLALWDFIVVGLNILDLRSLDVCHASGYPWWQWGILLSHLIYVLVINLRIPVVTLG
jgi:hypothetical protein